MMRISRVILCTLLAGSAMGGCAASYKTPGGPAPMTAFGLSENSREALTDARVREVTRKQPLASFPATLAVARVQASGYRNFCIGSYGHGMYSVVTAKDVETEADFDRIRTLPHVRSVAPVSRLILPEKLETDIELRRAAASLGADILVIYTFDTQYRNDDWAPPLALITFGIFPTEKTRVTTDATAVLMDVRNGFIYGALESASKKSRINNFWTDDEAADSARREAEREALDGLLAGFEKTWVSVVQTYAVAGPAFKPVVLDEDLQNLFPATHRGVTSTPAGPVYRTR
jgi:hypothetical protein